MHLCYGMIIMSQSLCELPLLCLIGYYIYLEGSFGGTTYNARLLSSTLVSDVDYCMEFYYHMYGQNVNRLDVLLLDDRETLIWTKLGNQGNRWFQALIQFTHSGTYKVLQAIESPQKSFTSILVYLMLLIFLLSFLMLSYLPLFYLFASPSVFSLRSLSASVFIHSSPHLPFHLIFIYFSTTGKILPFSYTFILCFPSFSGRTLLELCFALFLLFIVLSSLSNHSLYFSLSLFACGQ